MDILKLEEAIKYYKQKINDNVLVVNERDVTHLEQLQTIYNKIACVNVDDISQIERGIK